MSEPIEIDGFLSEDEQVELLAELNAVGGTAATVMSASSEGVVAEHARRTTRVAVSDATRERVRQRLLGVMPELAGYFGIPVTTCEAPQFLRYDPGDFFVPHQDGNTALIQDDSRFRRISAVIFLSPRSEEPAPGAYGGGDLLFHGRYFGASEPIAASGTPGSMVAFPSEETHEVTMVTHGVRFTVAAWFR